MHRIIFLFIILSSPSVNTFAQIGIRLQYEPEFSYTRDLSNRWSSNGKISMQNTFIEPSKEAATGDYQISYTQVQLFATYSLWTSTKLSGGYGFRFEDLLKTPLGYEHRVMEQIAFLTYLEGRRIAHRFRIEQRFSDEDYENRWRYRIAYDAPLNGRRLDPGEKYLITSNEFLFSFNRSGSDGENRLYIGLGWFFNDKRKLEAGIQYRLGEIGTDNPENTLWFTTGYYLNQ